MDRKLTDTLVGAPRRPEGGAGMVVAMTDLFVSAAAALLIVLVLSQTDIPTPLPVQAALVAFCPTTPDGPYLVGTAAALLAASADAESPLPPLAPVAGPEDLARVVGLPGLTPEMLQIVALSAGPKAPLDAECLMRFDDRIVEGHNQAQARVDPKQGPRTVFAPVPLAHPVPFPGEP